MRLFALHGSEDLGAAVARALWTTLDPHEERDFADGEHKVRPLVGLRGDDVYVLHSLDGSHGASANDKLCKLLFFIAACRDNGARSVTAVVPYLAYARKDRQTKTRDPVSTRTVAQLFEAVGTGRLVALDIHNLAAFQNAFRIPTVHLDTRRLFVPQIRELAAGRPIAVVSPDGGGIKRAELFREMYERETGSAAGFALMEKRRSRDVVSGDLFAGDVSGMVAVIVDDMISSGGTMLRAAEACRSRGAAEVYAVAAHGLFGKADELLSGSAFDRILVTDSVAGAERAKAEHPEAPLVIVPAAPLIAEAIRLLDGNGSISELLGTEG